MQKKIIKIYLGQTTSEALSPLVSCPCSSSSSSLKDFQRNLYTRPTKMKNTAQQTDAITPRTAFA